MAAVLAPLFVAHSRFALAQSKRRSGLNPAVRRSLAMMWRSANVQTGRVHVLLQKLPPLAPLSDRARPSLLSYLYLVSVGFASVLSDLIFRLPPFAVSVSVSGRSSVSGCSPREHRGLYLSVLIGGSEICPLGVFS